jgi:hypothetical protein
LVFAAALLYLWPLRDFLSFNADEGVTLTMAERILHGQVLYRDFFSCWTPGSPYLMALWFKLFGTTFVVARSVLMLYAGVFAAITYRLARRTCGRSASLFAAGVLVCGCLPHRFLVIHNWDSTIFALLAIYCAHSLLDAPSRTSSFVLGFATALTCLIEQSKGAGLVLGLGIAILVLGRSRSRQLRIAPGRFCMGAAGFALPWAITFAYFASQHALKAAVDAWLWPLHHYSAVNRLAFGTLPMSGEDLRGLYSSATVGTRIFILGFSAPMILIPVLAVLVIASTVRVVAVGWSGTRSPALDAGALGGCIFVGLFLSTMATGRADLNHLTYLTPLFLYLVPSTVAIRYRGEQLFGRARPIAAGLLLISFMGFGLITILKATAATATVATRRGTVRPAYPDEVLAFVQKNVPERGHLYVHPYQPLYSFMTATVNPTRMIFLQPGLNTADQYEATIRDLEADGTPYVLFNTDFADKISAVWPSTPAEAAAYDPVADYILEHYRMCRVLNPNPQQMWRFYFMVRMDGSCPAQR